jgi:hypothetical protein
VDVGVSSHARRHAAACHYLEMRGSFALTTPDGRGGVASIPLPNTNQHFLFAKRTSTLLTVVEYHCLPPRRVGTCRRFSSLATALYLIKPAALISCITADRARARMLAASLCANAPRPPPRRPVLRLADAEPVVPGEGCPIAISQV